MLFLVIECGSTEYTCCVHPHMLMNSSDALLFVLQVYMRAFSLDRPCQHNTRLIYLDGRGYDAEGTIMEEIPARGCSYIYLVGDFSFGRLPEDEQLLVVPFVMHTLRVAGLGKCHFGPLHPEATEIRLRYSGYREGAGSDSCLTYTSRYFSLYERPGILVENPFRTAKSIAELGEENDLGLISIRQAAALGFLGFKAPKKLKRRVEILLTGDQRTSMSRNLAVEIPTVLPLLLGVLVTEMKLPAISYLVATNVSFVLLSR